MISDKLDGSSQILTKEEDLSNKESVLKKRKELEELQRNLYNKNGHSRKEIYRIV